VDEEEKRLEAEVYDELLEMYDDLEEPASLQLVEDFQGWILLLALQEKPSIIIIIPLLTLGLNKTVLQKTHFEGKVDRALRMKVSKTMEISVWVRVIYPSRTCLGHYFLYPYSLENGQKEMLLGRLGEVLDYPMMNLKNYD